mgnify:CR=1 FL=1
MILKEYINLIIGINRIAHEVFQNFYAYNSILYNDYIEIEKQLPLNILMLLKNHYQVYIIELSKLISSGKNHFNINSALNGISDSKDFLKESRELKKGINQRSKSIKKVIELRNQIFAHLDKNYYSYKFDICINDLEDLHQSIESAIQFLNRTINLPKNLDYRYMESPKINDFYNSVFMQIINSK